MEGAFFTHFSEEEGRPVNLSKEFKDPVILLNVIPGAGQVSSQKALRPGESFRGPWGTVTFREYRRAVKFFVRRERGVSLLYAGFLLACLALVYRLTFYRRELSFRLEGEGEGARLEVGGRAEYYQSLFEEEFDRVLARQELWPEAGVDARRAERGAGGAP